MSQEKEGNHWFALPYQRMNRTAVCGQEMDQIQNNSVDSMVVKERHKTWNKYEYFEKLTRVVTEED